MTKRKHQLLTESERDQILAIPTDRDHLARLYTFEPSDIEIIGARRERRNQLGVALQLALLRHPGITLAQLIQDRGAIPHDLAAFVAEQLGLHVTELANYAARDQTMTDHARELAARLGLRGPTRADIPFMVEAAARTAWATDKGAPQGLSYGQRQSEQMVNKGLSVAAKYIKFRGFVRLDELEVTGSPLVMFHPRSS